MEQQTRTGDRTKRAELKLTADGELLVAGAFCRRFGPLKARIRCHDPRDQFCACGFNAHRDPLQTLLYWPIDAPIADVHLSERLRWTGPRDIYLLGLAQQVTRLRIPRLCSPCARAGRGLVEPAGVRELDGALRPVCASCQATHALDEVQAAAGAVPVEWSSLAYAHWATLRLTPTEHQLPRCVCTRVDVLEWGHGLRWYHDVFWGSYESYDETSILYKCLGCGALWDLDRAGGDRAVRH